MPASSLPCGEEIEQVLEFGLGLRGKETWEVKF
jgi:hypothetical protein